MFLFLLHLFVQRMHERGFVYVLGCRVPGRCLFMKCLQKIGYTASRRNETGNEKQCTKRAKNWLFIVQRPKPFGFDHSVHGKRHTCASRMCTDRSHRIQETKTKIKIIDTVNMRQRGQSHFFLICPVKWPSKRDKSPLFRMLTHTGIHKTNRFFFCSSLTY